MFILKLGKILRGCSSDKEHHVKSGTGWEGTHQGTFIIR